MKKTLLVVGLLLVILVMLSGNVQEGLTENDIQTDINKFNQLYSNAKNNNDDGTTKSRTTTLDNLNFENGSGKGQELNTLIGKYDDGDSNRKVTNQLNVDTAINKLQYRMSQTQ
jgi:hypothetical protein